MIGSNNFEHGFNPDYSPKELEQMGVYDQVYGDAPSEASMKEWPERWFYGPDKMGWLEWYEKYYRGRRLPEVDRKQINRWKSFKARHGAQYKKNPSARRKAALRNWAIDAEKLMEEKNAMLSSKIARILRHRKNMPQVKDSKKIPCKTKKETVNPKTLNPSQKSFNAEKVANIKKEIKKGSFNFKPIIISKDNHILDGHHRWKAALGVWDKIPVIRIPKDRKEALDYLKKKVEDKGRKKSASWEMGMNMKSPFELGIYSKKTNENNRLIATHQGVPSAALTGAAIGAVAKGATGEPTPNLIRKAIKGQPLTSERYKKQVNFPEVKRTYKRTRKAGGDRIKSITQAAKKLNLKKIKPQAIKGGLIGAAGGIGIMGAINSATYQLGRTIANTDSAESGLKKKIKKD